MGISLPATSADIYLVRHGETLWNAVGMVAPGTFIAAVGADNLDKSEIAPRLMAAATVVTDVLAQCAEMGDLRHAIDAGTMTAADVNAELGQVLVDARPGRSSPEEIIIFDSTGTGAQDVAAAAAIYERCVSKGLGQAVAMAELPSVRNGSKSDIGWTH